MSRLSACLALAVPTALYLLTLFPGLGGRFGVGDALQFQYLGTVLGVAHEPGYPQYVLLSFLWSHLPLPVSLAVQVNLLSTVCVLVAGALLFRVARALSDSVIGAVLAVWAVLLGYDIWTAATQAEVYALNLAWVAAVIWAAVLWSTTLERKWLVVLLFVYALSFGNHLTMITLLPAIAVLVLTRDPGVLVDRKMILAGAAAIGLGLAQYGLMLWRSFYTHPTLPSRFPRDASLGDLAGYMSGTHFLERNLLRDTDLLGRLVEGVSRGAAQLTPGIVMLGLWGGYLLWKRSPHLAGFLLLTAAGELLFAVAYDIGEWRYYCLPVWLVLGLLAAVPIGHLSRRWRPAQLVVVGLLLLTLTASVAANYSSLREDRHPIDYTDLLNEALPVGTIVATTRNRRQPELVGHYYRYGLGMEWTHNVSFVAARAVFEDRPEYLGDRLLLFQSPEVRDVFERFHADFVARRFPDGGSYFAAGTRRPVTELTFVPTEAGGLRVRVPRRGVFCVEHEVCLVFISRLDGRLKGVNQIRPGRVERGLGRARRQLRHLGDGDWIALVATASTNESRSRVHRFLQSQRIDDPALGPGGQNLVVVWQKRSAMPFHALGVDIEEAWRVRLPNSRRRSR